MQNVDKVSALLTVNIEKADYQERVEKVLKKYRQQVNMPGFRKGMVPMSLIKKQFGKSCERQCILHPLFAVVIRSDKEASGMSIPAQSNDFFHSI